MQEKNNILMIGDFDYNDQQVLKKVVNGLQQQLDIDPKIIEEWLNSDYFVEFLQSKDRESYREIMNHKNPILDKLMDISHVESFIDEYLFWEKEMCGQIIDEFGNGYIKYCNKHKYLHQSKSTTKKTTDQANHLFVRKTANEILEEQIFKVKFHMYLQMTRNLAQTIENDFFQFINKQGYTEHFVSIDDTDELIKWLKINQESFRSKYPIYEKDLIDIKNEKNERRTLKTLRTLRTLRNTKKNNNISNTNEQINEKEEIDIRDQKIYIKVYIAPNNITRPNAKIISRSTL